MAQSIPKLRKRKKLPEIKKIRPEIVEMNLSRRSIYQFLTRIFFWEMNSAFLQRFKLPMVQSLLKDLGWKLELDFKQQSDDEIIQELEAEYTRLFLKPAEHTPLHKSVQNFIETSGSKFSEGFTGNPDYIGVELEFIRHIADIEFKAIETNNFDEVLFCLKLAEQFISEHLLSWIESFSRQVTEQAEHPFYRSAAAATREVIQFDHKQLQEILSSLNLKSGL